MLQDQDVVGLGDRVQGKIEKLEEEKTRRLVHLGRRHTNYVWGEQAQDLVAVVWVYWRIRTR